MSNPPTLPTLIGLCGYAGVGKDAVAAALAPAGWHRAAFADALKADLAPLVARLSPDTPKSVIRPLYVAWGEACRHADPAYWIGRLAAALPQSGNVVITDVRYTNEAEFVLRRGGVVVRVCRPCVGPANETERESILQIDARLPRLLPYIQNDTIPQRAAADVLLAAREWMEYH